MEVLKDSCFQDSGFTGESSLHFGPHLIFVPFIEPHATWKWKISTESNGLSRWIILGSTWFINPTWKLFKGGNYSRVETIRGNTVHIFRPRWNYLHCRERSTQFFDKTSPQSVWIIWIGCCPWAPSIISYVLVTES